MSLPEVTAEKLQMVSGARSWSPSRKIATVIFVSIFAFLATFAASIIAPSRPEIQAYFAVSRTVSVLPFSLFNLGLAWGTVIGSPASETYGRRVVYLVCMPTFLIFVMACGFSHNVASLLVCRFLGGICASPALTLASATISDLFEPGSARGVALFCYYSMPWVGSVLGPLIGAVVVAYKPWEWTQWVFLFIAAPIILPGLIFLRETKQSVLETKAAHSKFSLIEPLKPQNLAKRCVAVGTQIPEFIRTSLLRPLEMLCTELIVALVCLYAGFNFGLIYALVVVFPDIFGQTYDFNTVNQGLSFLGLIAGCFVGPAVLIIDNEIIHRRISRSGGQEDQAFTTKPSPEMRLHGAMLGAVLLPVGLLWFAWTARPSTSFWSPIFASVLITLGSLTIYVSTSVYVIDTYGPKYGASANGASSIVRYTMAAVVPLFILEMYDGLGTGWATSVLALCAVVMMPIPFWFHRKGSALRQRCKFQTEQQ